MKEALKKGDKDRVTVIRMLNARILEKEVELRSARGRDYQLSDDEVVDVLNAYAKQRRHSIDSYRQGGRSDLVEQEESQLEIVEEYLPRRLTPEEIREVVEEVIAETGASSLKEMGVVMKTVMARTHGRADGREVNQIVKERLIARG